MVARLHFETMVFWPGRTWSSGPSAPAGDWDAWQAERYQRGETGQRPGCTGSPFRPR